jgi:hypothetical protein
MSARSPACRRLPLTSSQIFPRESCPTAPDRMKRTDRRRLRERLADVPRALLLAHVALQVAARHVEPDRVTPDQARRRLGAHVHAGAADRDDELDLVMKVLRRERIGDAPDRRRNHRDDRVGGLGEEERRLLARIAAHFLRVLRIVAADAVDVANRKALRAVGDGHRGDFPGLD